MSSTVGVGIMESLGDINEERLEKSLHMLSCEVDVSFPECGGVDRSMCSISTSRSVVSSSVVSFVIISGGRRWFGISKNLRGPPALDCDCVEL